MADLYRPGDYFVQCDRCGFKHYASETKKTWDGLRVCKADWEARHPQDLVRGKVDRQKVADPRPEAADTFRGTNDVTPESL